MFARSGARGLILSISLAVLGASPDHEVWAQLRALARVHPNREAVSRTADLYDPSAGTLSAVPASEAEARTGHTATLLQDGKVLFAGGYDGGYLDGAHLYDPSSAGFTRTTSLMKGVRSAHTATLLTGGKVLLTGGYTGTHLNTAELYDPSTDSFALTSGNLTLARSGHTATLLAEKVLIAGGFNGAYLNAAELYDPSSDAFTATAHAMTVARRGHTATLLGNGKVLIAGGRDGGTYLSSAELYDPATDTFTATSGSMHTARSGHTAALLSNGKVLIAGGFNGTSLDSAEIFDPATGTFSEVGQKMTAARSGHAASVLPGGRVLLSGGEGTVNLTSLEIYDEAAGSFSAVPSAMGQPRADHTATTLADGQVLILGGRNVPFLMFDLNLDATDNISPNILFSADSRFGYAAYTGSGTIVVFWTETGDILQRIKTGGYPAFATALPDGNTMVVPSALENRIFRIDMTQNALTATYSFTNALFGFGSIVTVSPDGTTGYISSTGTGEVIKFGLADGRELGRLKGLQGPAQVTLTKDGSTLIVVDTLTEELVFADTASLTRKATLKTREQEPTANLYFFHKAVLSPGGESGIIVSRDDNGLLADDTAFVFSTSTGQVIDTEKIGSDPGITGLTPDGRYWVVLCDLSIAVIPTTDPAAKVRYDTVRGSPLGTANIAFSSDSRYAYYVSSESDFVFQHDLITDAVLSQVLTGDDPNAQLDQPGAVAITPDGKTVTALNVVGNMIDLMREVTVLEGTRFTSSSRVFTGLSLVNLGSVTARVWIEALDNYGTPLSDTAGNPAVLDLAPSGQLSMTVEQIFGFNPDVEHVGHIRVTSEQPGVVGYLSSGEARFGFLSFYLERMNGAGLFQDRLHDFIIPEVTRQEGISVELDFVNPNYNLNTYDLTRHAPNGGVLEEKTGNVAYATNRQVQYFADMFTVPGSGKVLLTGGESSGTAVSSAETYDPTSQTFASTATMTAARTGHAMVVLPNGKVLVTGGNSSSASLSSAEVYDNSTLTFTATTGTMTVSRERHTATLLPTGKVLLVGGLSSGSAQSSAEVYDPNTQAFTATAGVMSVARYGHTATLLPNGRVLIAGGNSGSAATSVAEIFDPATGIFTATGAMNSARAFHTATLLPGGKVLIAGGHDGTNYLDTAEIYDPSTGTFTTTGSMKSTRQDHTATLLADGRVLIAGGYNGSALDSADLYTLDTGSFAAASGTLTAKRRRASATLLPDRRVLIAGGNDGTNALTSADIFDPTNNSIAGANAMSVARSGHAALFLEGGEDGYLRVKSTAGLAFTEYYGGGARSASINGIDVDKFSGVTALYAPLLVIGSQNKVILNLINANTADAELTLTLHRHDGSTAGGPLTQTLFTGAQLKGDLAEIFGIGSSLEPGIWLEVRSSVDKIVGTITLINSDESVLTVYELSGIPLSDFIFPVSASDSLFKTAVGLVNGNSDGAAVTVEFWGPAGALDDSTGFTLAPGEHLSSYLADLFPKLGPKTVGYVRVRSNVPLHALSVMTDIYLDFLMAESPIAVPSPASESQTTALPARTNTAERGAASGAAGSVTIPVNRIRR